MLFCPKNSEMLYQIKNAWQLSYNFHWPFHLWNGEVLGQANTWKKGQRGGKVMANHKFLSGELIKGQGRDSHHDVSRSLSSRRSMGYFYFHSRYQAHTYVCRCHSTIYLRRVGQTNTPIVRRQFRLNHDGSVWSGSFRFLDMIRWLIRIIIIIVVVLIVFLVLLKPPENLTAASLCWALRAGDKEHRSRWSFDQRLSLYYCT